MKIQVTLSLSEQFRTFELKGRLGWAMVQLVEAGANGVTTIERPAPRWSGYVHELRGMGIPIETEMVTHEGRYPGHHARYRLTCDVTLTILDEGGSMMGRQRPQLPSQAVRRIMRKHGLPEPSARAYALLA